MITLLLALALLPFLIRFAAKQVKIDEAIKRNDLLHKFLNMAPRLDRVERELAVAKQDYFDRTVALDIKIAEMRTKIQDLENGRAHP